MSAMSAILLVTLLLAAAAAASGQEQGSLPVHGRVVVPDGVSLAQAEVWLQLESGERRVAFPLPDGAFTFADVPLGVHTLSVEQQQLLYPTLRLDVGVGRKGKVSAVAIDVTGTPALPPPLLVRPLAMMDYFERRVPFNAWAYLKTPYGMMAGFMLFSMFIMPKLKLDPEEMKEYQEQRAASRSTSSGGAVARRRDD